MNIQLIVYNTLYYKVSKFRIGPHRIGHVITTGDTLGEAISALDRARKNIHIVVKPLTEGE